MPRTHLRLLVLFYKNSHTPSVRQLDDLLQTCVILIILFFFTSLWKRCDDDDDEVARCLRWHRRYIDFWCAHVFTGAFLRYDFYTWRAGDKIWRLNVFFFFSKWILNGVDENIKKNIVKTFHLIKMTIKKIIVRVQHDHVLRWVLLGVCVWPTKLIFHACMYVKKGITHTHWISSGNVA